MSNMMSKHLVLWFISSCSCLWCASLGNKPQVLRGLAKPRRKLCFICAEKDVHHTLLQAVLMDCSRKGLLSELLPAAFCTNNSFPLVLAYREVWKKLSWVNEVSVSIFRGVGKGNHSHPELLVDSGSIREEDVFLSTCEKTEILLEKAFFPVFSETP